jgi:hypothetical protein
LRPGDRFDRFDRTHPGPRPIAEADVDVDVAAALVLLNK